MKFRIEGRKVSVIDGDNVLVERTAKSDEEALALRDQAHSEGWESIALARQTKAATADEVKRVEEGKAQAEPKKADPFDHDGKDGPGGSKKGKKSTVAKGKANAAKKAK